MLFERLLACTAFNQPTEMGPVPPELCLLIPFECYCLVCPWLVPQIKTCAEKWEKERTMSGLSSGEGLIHNVRDPITELKRDKNTKKTVDVVVDAGVDDKRLLVVEPEFSKVLRVCQRDTNTLSAVIRLSWDQGNLRTLTKNSPAKATGAHVSVIGHVVADELRRYLDRSEIAGGFGNRFLWLCVRRSQCLPDGGELA